MWTQTHLKRPWWWERLRAGREGDGREWDGWMTSPTQWTCIWVNSGSWWWTGRPGMVRFMGWQRVRPDWVTGLNWTEYKDRILYKKLSRVFAAWLEQGSVQFSLDQWLSPVQLLWTTWLQYVRPPCPLPTTGAYLNSCWSHWWCHPTISSSVFPFSSCLQSFPASGFFSNESVLHIRWPKYWSFSFSISPSNQYSGLIAFRIDWLDLLAVQGTHKSSPTQGTHKSSPTQQFKSINSLAFRFLFCPNLTSIDDYWNDHSFD